MLTQTESVQLANEFRQWFDKEILPRAEQLELDVFELFWNSLNNADSGGYEARMDCAKETAKAYLDQQCSSF